MFFQHCYISLWPWSSVRNPLLKVPFLLPDQRHIPSVPQRCCWALPDWPCPEVGALSWAQPELWEELRQWISFWRKGHLWSRPDLLRQNSLESRQAAFPTEWPTQMSPWLAQVIKISLCYSKLTLLWVWRELWNHFPNLRNYLYNRS